MPHTLDDVRTALNAWKGIELTKTANPVMGHGNPKAEIMFIGEAPGQKEDEQGIPFVGQAGKLLDELLGTIGLKREDVYITNVVKFRPPENRDPTPEEKTACLPFLQMEIAIIKPKLIVPLGRHALTQFFTKMSISEAHGKAHTIREAEGKSDAITVFPIYHPAAALHNPGLRQALFDDFKGLGEHLASMKQNSD
ncbi:uracil-DNA glycosylase [Candidatus Peribacteria bacterium]|nr:MAG: uracil-DNA glycosylase [Candidatus Peribacteria bacterium]